MYNLESHRHTGRTSSEPGRLGSRLLIFKVVAVCGSLKDYIVVPGPVERASGVLQKGVEIPFGGQPASCTSTVCFSGFTLLPVDSAHPVLSSESHLFKELTNSILDLH